MGNDADWQRHNANRNGQEGRYQDRTGTSYEIGSKLHRGPVLYIQLRGRGPRDGAWISEAELKREFRKM